MGINSFIFPETKETVTDFIFLGPKITAAMKLKMLPRWKKSYDKPRQHVKKQRHYFAYKGLYSQRYGFSSSQVWELDNKKAELHWCFWTVVLEKTLGSPLDSKEIKPVNLKGYQPWIFTGRTDAEAEASILSSTWYKKPTHWKRPWCWERLEPGWEGTTEDEMVGWHHWLSGHEFEQAPGDSKGQGSWHAAVHGVAKSPVRLSNWTTTIIILILQMKKIRQRLSSLLWSQKKMLETGHKHTQSGSRVHTLHHRDSLRQVLIHLSWKMSKAHCISYKQHLLWVVSVVKATGKVKWKSLSCPTLCDTVHGILQVKYCSG